MDIESYIKDLSPELQEKARACCSVEELLALAKDAKVPLPDEALAAIAGGEDQEDGGCVRPTCPKCKSANISSWEESVSHGWIFHFTCKDCGYQWTKHFYQ